MPVNPTINYRLTKCEPIYPISGGQSNVNWMPNLAVARGTVVGQVTAVDANEVQTIGELVGDPIGGTFTLSIANIDGAGVATTAALAWNISNANLTIALDALLATAGYLGATVAVGGGTIATSFSAALVTVTFGGTAAAFDMPQLVFTDIDLVRAGPNPATLTIATTTPGNRQELFGVYNNGAADGRQTALGIAVYDFRTDRFGRVVYAAAGDSPEHGDYYVTSPVWFQGRFRTTDLTGLDAPGIADLGRLESGVLADGILSLM